MSDPPPTLFPPPPPAASPRERWGCGNPFLAGCGLLLLLLLAASAYVVASGDRLFRWGLEQTRATVVAALPPEATPAERSRLEESFRAVEEGVVSGRIDQDGLRRLREELGTVRTRIRKGTFGRAEALALMDRLEEIAGGGQENTPPGNGTEEGSR